VYLYMTDKRPENLLQNNDFKPQRFHNNDALTNITRSKPDSP